MGIATARDIIESSFIELGITSIAETPSASDVDVAFDKLNLMVDSWSADDLLHAASASETFPLIAGTNNYNIGSNQTFDTTKPFYVESAFIRSASGEDYFLKILNKKDYDVLLDKDIGSLPGSLTYYPLATQQVSQYGIIYIYPSPDVNYTLHLTSLKPFDQFDNLNSNVNFPAGYKKALIENLAINIASSFGANITPSLAVKAEQSLDRIERINARNQDKTIEFNFPVSIRQAHIREGY